MLRLPCSLHATTNTMPPHKTDYLGSHSPVIRSTCRFDSLSMQLMLDPETLMFPPQQTAVRRSSVYTSAPIILQLTAHPRRETICQYVSQPPMRLLISHQSSPPFTSSVAQLPAQLVQAPQRRLIATLSKNSARHLVLVRLPQTICQLSTRATFLTTRIEKARCHLCRVVQHDKPRPHHPTGHDPQSAIVLYHTMSANEASGTTRYYEAYLSFILNCHPP